MALWAVADDLRRNLPALGIVSSTRSKIVFRPQDPLFQNRTHVKTLFGFGPQIKNSVDKKPDGLLLHENFIMSLIPLHLGIRQYWRDFDALEAWALSTPHREWWRDFLRSSRGTGFWHEAYFMRGGMEAVYDDVPVPLGFGQFAPMQPARGPMFSARARAKLAGEPRPAVVEEAEHYGVAGRQ